MGLPSFFLEKKYGKHEKGDDITPFDGTSHESLPLNWFIVCCTSSMLIHGTGTKYYVSIVLYHYQHKDNHL
jgi:hypothetical protein